MTVTATTTATRVQTERVTQVEYGETIVLPPPPLPPGDVIALVNAQSAMDDSIMRRTVVITITVVLLYITPEDWKLELDGLSLESSGIQASYLLTLAMLWIFRTIPRDLLEMTGQGVLISRCKIDLSQEYLAKIEVIERKWKFVPPLRNKFSRFMSGLGEGLGLITSFLLFVSVFGLAAVKVIETASAAISSWEQGDLVGLVFIIFVTLLLLNIFGYLMSALFEAIADRRK